MYICLVASITVYICVCVTRWWWCCCWWLLFSVTHTTPVACLFYRLTTNCTKRECCTRALRSGWPTNFVSRWVVALLLATLTWTNSSKQQRVDQHTMLVHTCMDKHSCYNQSFSLVLVKQQTTPTHEREWYTVERGSHTHSICFHFSKRKRFHWNVLLLLFTLYWIQDTTDKLFRTCYLSKYLVTRDEILIYVCI